MNEATLRLAGAGVCFFMSTFSLYLLILQHPSHDNLLAGDSNSNLGDNVDAAKQQIANVSAEEDTETSVIWAIIWKVEEFGSAARELNLCKEYHLAYITVLFCVLYLYKQAFAIPGSFFLNVAAGALFGIVPAFCICCLLTTVGSALCYGLSSLFGRAYLSQKFGARIDAFQQRMNANSHRLFLFLIFARLLPISPSWLVNIAAPVLAVPFDLFLITTSIGLAPYIFIGVHAGSILSELHDWRDIFTPTILTQLTLISVVPQLMIYISDGRRTKIPRVHSEIKILWPISLVPLILAYYISRPQVLNKLGINTSPKKCDKELLLDNESDMGRC